MKSLYILTATYPYDYQECFLEDEIKYLSERFDRTILIPLGGKNTKQRIVPKNCYIDSRLHCSRIEKIVKGVVGVWRVFPLYSIDFFCNKVYLSTSRMKRWLRTMLLTSYYLQSSTIKELNKSISPKDILYSYWGTEYNTIFPYLRSKCKLVSRFHGFWDLWQSNVYEGYIPLRKYVINSLSCGISISKMGESFLKERYPKLYIKTFHLGSQDFGIGKKIDDGVIRVVSCSTVNSLKRVPLIFESLKCLCKESLVEWVHIGDGPDYSYLQSLIEKNKCENLKVHLLGGMPHSSVMDYYLAHSVDIFVNLSTSEGIPVSIMEAASFDIPIVATNVGGTSEIVTKDTGILVSSSPSPNEVADAIRSLYGAKISPRDYWISEFNAKTNYSAFAQFLYQL